MPSWTKTDMSDFIHRSYQEEGRWRELIPSCHPSGHMRMFFDRDRAIFEACCSICESPRLSFVPMFDHQKDPNESD